MDLSEYGFCLEVEMRRRWDKWVKETKKFSWSDGLWPRQKETETLGTERVLWTLVLPLTAV